MGLHGPLQRFSLVDKYLNINIAFIKFPALCKIFYIYMYFNNVILNNPIVSPILQLRTLRDREVKFLALDIAWWCFLFHL